MHLSTTNNRPDLAREMASDALGGRRVRLHVAAPRETLVLDAGAGPPAAVRAAGGRAGEQLALFAGEGGLGASFSSRGATTGPSRSGGSRSPASPSRR